MGRKVNYPMNSNSYIFIDLSSFIFHRYFAIRAWTKISGANEMEEEALKALVLEKYNKTFREKFLAIQKKFKTPWNQVYVAKDCPRDTIWRRDLYPDYKRNRDDRVLDFDPTVFVQTYEVILPELQKAHNFHMLGYKQAEADDVIAVLKAKLRRDKPNAEIVIITNDNDYVQLLDENTQILSSTMKPLKDKYTQEVLDVFVKYKVIKGDPSDNIPPIDNKVGDKTALKLASNSEMLVARLQKNETANKQYDLNTTLIDFNRIPKAIRKGIEDMI